MNCEPLFTTVDLFPFDKEEKSPEKIIDQKAAYLKNMSEEKFTIWVELLRQHFIDIHKRKHHPVFGSHRSNECSPAT